MIEFLIFVALALALPALLLGLLQIVAPQSTVHERVRQRLAQFRLWQLVVVVILCGLLASMATVSLPGIPFLLIVLILLCLFLKSWRDDFLFLMGLRDEDFPGRNDKVIWVLLLLLAAPLGGWLFRSYRLSHWPQREQMRDPEPAQAAVTFPSPS